MRTETVLVESINPDKTVNIRVNGLLIPRVRTVSKPKAGQAVAIVINNEYVVL